MQSVHGVWQAPFNEYPKNTFSGANHGSRNEDMLYQTRGNNVVPITHSKYGVAGEVEFHSIHLMLHTGVTLQNPECKKGAAGPFTDTTNPEPCLHGRSLCSPYVLAET